MPDLDLGVVLSIIGIVISFSLWLLKPEMFKNIFTHQKIIDYTLSKNIKDDFTIAVVDDELESYPIPYIQSLGYKTKTFNIVSFSQAEELSLFDLILLDVKGVVKEDLDEGGAKLIKLIKEYRPLIPIVAVSSGYFHTELNDYFKTCDDNIKKPIDQFKIREILSELKQKFYDENELSKLIDNDIHALHISGRKKKNISLSIIKYLKGDLEEDNLKVNLHRIATTRTDDLLCNIHKLKDRFKHA